MVLLKAPIKAPSPLASVSHSKLNLITHEAINSCQYKPTQQFPPFIFLLALVCLFVRSCACVSALGAVNLEQQV